MKRYETNHVCANCGKSYGDHRAADDKCPPDTKSPHWGTVQYEALIDAWWAGSTTFFDPDGG